MKTLIALLTSLFITFVAPAQADPGLSPPVVDGGDTGASAINCSVVKVHWTDTFHEYLGRTWRIAGRVAYQHCYDSGPGANYIRLTHVGAWYEKTQGIDPACGAVAGAPRIDGFTINIDGIGGYDPAPFWMNCDGTMGDHWVDIPNRKILPSGDRCFDVSWGKFHTADGKTHAFSNFQAVCIPLP